MRWPLAGRSLRWRLTLAGAGAIVIAILGAALGLALLFERHVERVAAADLEARIHAIAARVETGTDGRPVLRPVEIDPLYTRPFSGHYWQIELDGQRMRSRSLWDHVLIWPEGAADQGPGDGQARRVDLTGPMGEPLLAREARFAVGPAAVQLRILVATDREDLEAARRGFLGDLVPVLGVLGVLLGIGSWVQLRMGLGPLADLSARVAGLRDRAQARMGSDLPTEVLPLAQEIDLLLDARAADLDRARHRAADLAHGFKTPLQALFGDADELRAMGAADMADSVERVAASMRAIVDRELMRARIQSDRLSARAEVGPVVARVVEVLRRTPAGKALDWQIEEAPGGCVARIDGQDLTEAMGAILENACRFAQARVRVGCRRLGGQVEIAVRDDGPGVAEADLALLAERGKRLDEGGQGIGLALVADIAAAAQGEVSFRNAGPGLEVVLTLQAA